MTNFLVTGGAGFIGANFVRYWRARYPNDSIVVLDALTYAGNVVNLAGIDEIRLVHGDIRDFDLVKRLLGEGQIDALVHFAAESHVDRSIHAPDAFIDTNVIGTHTLLKAAKTVWLDSGSGKEHHFHHVSTDEVYGSLQSDERSFAEDAAYRPNSPYSASKAASDHLVRAYNRTYGLKVTTTNCSNNYGPYQFPEKLIPLFIINALSGLALPVYGTGGNVRDWLYVDDHCRGIELVLRKGAPGETYNIGGGEEMPNTAVIERICAAVDQAFIDRPDLAKRFPKAPAAEGKASNTLITFVADRKGHDWRYAINEHKIRRELGYTPMHDFSGAIAKTVQWYLDNETWWRAVMDGSYRSWISENYNH